MIKGVGLKRRMRKIICGALAAAMVCTSLDVRAFGAELISDGESTDELLEVSGLLDADQNNLNVLTDDAGVDRNTSGKLPYPRYSGGDGTVETPFLISSYSDLVKMREYCSNLEDYEGYYDAFPENRDLYVDELYNFKLTNDIYFPADEPWVKIPGISDMKLDGNGKTFHNVSFEAEEEYVVKTTRGEDDYRMSLFGRLKSVKNLIVNNVNITFPQIESTDKAYYAACIIAGRSETMSNCEITGTVKIINYNDPEKYEANVNLFANQITKKAEKCYLNATIEAQNLTYLCGLAGSCGDIFDCHINKDITLNSGTFIGFSGGNPAYQYDHTGNWILEKCSIADGISITSDSGSVYGFISSATYDFLDCSNGADITAYEHAAGFGGHAGSVSNCVNTGNITSSTYGAVGFFEEFGGTMLKCRNTGNITGGLDRWGNYSYTAGFVGDLRGTLMECINEGDIRGHEAGGIAGTTYITKQAAISKCGNNGTVSGYKAGGIIGTMNGTIELCWNKGKIVAIKDKNWENGVGGIAGEFESSDSVFSNKIVNCYNGGDITDIDKKNMAGGIAGSGGISIENCYNVGKIEGVFGDNVGGVGGKMNSKVFSGVHCVHEDSYGAIGNYDKTNYPYEGISINTDEELRKQETFSGWNFESIWTMGNEDYPYPVLQYESDNIHEIILDANGGTVNGKPSIILKTSSNGALRSMPRPKYSGKKFIGWYTSVDGGDKIDTTKIFTEEKTIYAHWVDYDLTKKVVLSNLTPENGATAVSYENRHDGENFTISFTTDVKIANVNLLEGGIRLVESSTGIVVYKVTSNMPAGVINSGSGSQVVIRCFDAELKPSCEYHVVIDEGVLEFEDESRFAFIDNKDDWHFKTGYSCRIKIRNEGPAYNDDVELPYDFSYDDSLFWDPATKYNHQRTIWAFGLAMAGFESYRGGERGDYTDGAKNAKEMMKQFGFETDSLLSVNNDYKEKPKDNSFGVCVGDKKIKDQNGKDYTLLAVTTRGAGYEAEWYSNGYIGTRTEHEGFYNASDKVLDRISNYIKTRNITGDVKIIMAGYSRAAATTNLAAARIDNGELSQLLSGRNVNIAKENVYAYCFEPPATTRKADETNLSVEEALQNDYGNITNILNPDDFVPFVPFDGAGWGYKRYGIDYYLPSDTLNSRKDYNTYRSRYLGMYYQFGMAFDNAVFNYYEFDLDNTIKRNIKSYIKQHEFDDITTKMTIYDMPLYMFNVKLRTELKQAIPSWWQYEKYTQKTICNCLKEAFTEGEIPWWLILEQCDFVVDEYGKIENSDIADCLVTLYRNVYDYDKGLLFQQHEPLLNFAKLVALEGNLQSKVLHNEIESFDVIFLNCPVDASVYNSSGELVAQIIKDTPKRIEGSFIGSYVDENGQKVFVLPRDDDFSIKINGTGTGKMDYAVSEYSVFKGDYTKKTAYYDVPVKEGDIFTATLDESGTSTLKDNSMTLINPSKTITGEIPMHEVSFSVLSGDGQIMGDTYVQEGNHVQLTAVPDLGADFIGWCDENGNLLVEDPENEVRRFRIEKDTTIYAKFSEVTDGVFATQIPDQTYDGTAKQPDVTVYDQKNVLTPRVDYTVTYKNNKNAFTFEDVDKLTDAQKKKAPQAIIRMKGNYSGQEVVYFCINPLSVDDEAAFEASVKKGKQTVIFKYNDKALKENTDYIVDSVKDDTVTVTGKGNFTGTHEFALAVKEGITNISMSKVIVDAIPTQFYTGTALTADTFKSSDGSSPYSIKVSYPKGTELTAGKDYVVKGIDNSVNVGTATVVLKGLKAGGTAGASDMYSFIGEKRIKVKIAPRPMDSAVVTGSDGSETLSAVYSKAGAKPENLTVVVEGRTLKEGRDYTVKYSANTKYSGTGDKSDSDGKLTVAGKGNYKGSKSFTFKITKRPFTEDSGINVNVADMPYSNKAGKFMSGIKVYDSEGKLLKAGTDYEKEIKYEAADGTELTKTSTPGEGDVITVKVTGKGGYTNDTMSATYKILKAGEVNDISKAKISIDPVAYRSGKVILNGDNASHVHASIGKDKKNLTFSTDGVDGDFMVLPGSYENNDKKGTAKVTFVGINNYSGSKTVTVKIGARSLVDWWKGLFM